MRTFSGRGRTCLVLAPFLVLAACQGGEVRDSPTATCAHIEQNMNFSQSVKTLNQLTQAFSQHCDETVIHAGARAQTEFRYKTFHVLKETASIFLPDGTLTDYVMESYERGFLSVLLAASYARRGQPDDAKVELRRLDQELFTPLYNYGEDPVNILLSAALWEQLGEPGEARVDWLRLRDLASLRTDSHETVRSFADRQVRRIDEGQPLDGGWRVYGLGQFPGVDWDLQFTGSDKGYFLVKAQGEFLPACASQTGVLISTHTWFEKIALRHNNAYHPLLHAQSWIRLPIGTMYSLVPVAAGASIAVGGCMLDASGKGKGALCEVSIRGGMVLMSTAPEVFRWALEPDLRHWERIPASFVVTTATELGHERCAPSSPREPILTLSFPYLTQGTRARHE